jgi:hypothetical protein
MSSGGSGLVVVADAEDVPEGERDLERPGRDGRECG